MGYQTYFQVISPATIQAKIHGRFTVTLLGSIPHNFVFTSSITMEGSHKYSCYIILLKRTLNINIWHHLR